MVGLSLRQVELVLQVFGRLMGFEAPDHSTVRLWALRVGLYLWSRASQMASDWIWIVDHVAQPGGGKCLVIVGVRRSELLGRGFVLRHTDVTLLYAEVMQTCNGEDMLRIFIALAARVGVPVQIVSDHGSDVLKGERLFQARNDQVVLTWDITHRMARLLLAAVQNDDTWTAFKSACQRTRSRVARTPWAALSPPSTTDSSRCEHIDTLVLWAEKAKARLAAGASGVIDTEHAWDLTASRSLSKTVSTADRRKLRPLLKQSFADKATFTQAVQQTLGESEHLEAIVKASDQGQRRCEEQFAWLESFHEELTKTYLPMVRMTYSVEKQVKHAGLHSDSARQWLASQAVLSREQKRARDFRAAILRYLRTEGAGHRGNAPVLGTSDVLESLFGKYKRYTDRSPESTLNSSILMLPIAMETLTPELITKAIESTPMKSLTAWCTNIFGRTTLGLHRLLSSLTSSTEPA